MPRSEVISVRIDIPDDLESEQELKEYIAASLQQYVQEADLVGTEEPDEDASNHDDIPHGKSLRDPGSAVRKRQPIGDSTQDELKAARIQLSRLNQRYNMAASRIQGATRRKHLLRAIAREQARIQSLETEDHA